LITEENDGFHFLVLSPIVYDQSTAGAAGVERGWIVNKINGTQLNYDQASAQFIKQYIFWKMLLTRSFEFIKTR
jgi:hypothetical protein